MCLQDLDSPLEHLDTLSEGVDFRIGRRRRVLRAGAKQDRPSERYEAPPLTSLVRLSACPTQWGVRSVAHVTIGAGGRRDATTTAPECPSVLQFVSFLSRERHDESSRLALLAAPARRSPTKTGSPAPARIESGWRDSNVVPISHSGQGPEVRRASAVGLPLTYPAHRPGLESGTSAASVERCPPQQCRLEGDAA